jgi:hypothetical protein
MLDKFSFDQKKTVFEKLLNIELSNQIQQLLNCPFHRDGKPSFSLNLEMGVYNCFGCGERGNTITAARYLLGDNDLRILLRFIRGLQSSADSNFNDYAKGSWHE